MLDILARRGARKILAYLQGAPSIAAPSAGTGAAQSRHLVPRLAMNRPPTALLALILLPRLLFADPALDREIEQTAASSYNFRTVLEKQVKVTAQEGIVTLTGSVLDQAQKTLAEETVRSLPGVTAIANNLQLASPGPERSDGWIALKLRSVLLLRSQVSATNTDVTVREGNVVLTGKADSTAQKELTETYAREVEGVKSVKNELVIAEPAPTGGNAASAGGEFELIDDSSITAQVKYALLMNESTRSVETHVETRNGVVIIRGTAATEAEKELVSKLARSVRGVAGIENGMTVSAHVAE